MGVCGAHVLMYQTDLVPREILAGWLTHLRSEVSAPVVSFRAPDAFIPSADKGKQKASMDSVSKDGLLDAIAEATKSHTERETRVAVVGLTNVSHLSHHRLATNVYPRAENLPSSTRSFPLPLSQRTNPASNNPKKQPMQAPLLAPSPSPSPTPDVPTSLSTHLG
jgi:hypothetical protein